MKLVSRAVVKRPTPENFPLLWLVASYLLYGFSIIEDCRLGLGCWVNGRFVPVRLICEFLGVSWTGQLRRLNRDAVLSEEIRSMNVTFIEPSRTR